MFTLQNLNVVRIVGTEVERDKLISGGFLLLKEEDQAVEKEVVTVEEEVIEIEEEVKTVEEDIKKIEEKVIKGKATK